MYRRVMMNAISSIMIEHGFETAEPYVLETLTDMLCAFMFEIGKSSRTYSELSGRAEPLAADVILTLVNMGLKVNDLEAYAKRPGKTVIAPPVTSVQPKQLSILQAGTKAPHPSYIPNHLPAFPDPHAYIRTPTHKQPVTEYEAIREKSAVQKRDIERALNKFAARTSETDSLFLCQDNLFPLIACKPVTNTPPYLIALLPKDQVFEQEDEGEFRSSPQRKRTLAVKELEEAQKEVEIDSPYLLPVKLPPPKIKIKDLLAQPLPPQSSPSPMPPPPTV